jgi:hypothetical protein
VDYLAGDDAGPVGGSEVVVAEAAPGGLRGNAAPAVAGSVTARLRQVVATTPGRLGTAMVGLILLSLLTGVLGLLSVQQRADTLDSLARYREPVSAAAQQIYRSLSDADATAASAFLSGSIEPAAMRDRYDTDIAQATAALAVAEGDAEGATDAALPMSQLSTQIPVYTGLVERAAANNANGFPVGSAYLREADGLMHNTLLPAAQRLYSVDTALLAQEQDEATSFPWTLVVLAVLLLAALIAAQRHLTRRTNRVINVGLLVGTIAVIVAVLWAGVGMVVETVHTDSGRSAGSDQVDLLAQVRTKALQARTDEMLTLVARGGEDYDGEFDILVKQFGGRDGSGGLLGQLRSDSTDPAMTAQVIKAQGYAKQWLALHDQVTKTSGTGDYPNAVKLALGSTGSGEAATFYNFDSTLDKAIEQGRGEFITQTETAGFVLSGMPLGMLVLALVAAIGSAVGIWKRLREYR